MFPDFDLSGVMPPFVGDDPTKRDSMSPYPSNVLELANRLGYTPARRHILRGLLSYREALRKAGITVGFQWLDGSFVENVEGRDGVDPKDIDVVTFFRRPVNWSPASWNAWFLQNKILFNAVKMKETFKCDAYGVDLDTPSENVVDQTRYWFGLFSHRRVTRQWKGMLQISLDASDDQTALERLPQQVIHE